MRKEINIIMSELFPLEMYIFPLVNTTLTFTILLANSADD